MNLYPAIDILEGRAVRLRQGRREDATVYGTPLYMAGRWVSQGARWLHVVDLDGAFAGEPRNADDVEQIRSRYPEIQIQVGGGIRSLAAVERILGSGIDRVIIGTAAVVNPRLLADAIGRFGDQVAVGIDAREGVVRLDGWTRDGDLTALDLAADLETKGVRLVIYTDISRDGELVGVNVGATRTMLEATQVAVIASGGISTSEDIVRLAEMAHPRLEGAIIGKALYEGNIDLREVLRVAEAGLAG